MTALPNIHILGIQGSGKGTQSTLLVEKYSLNYIPSGSLFRDRSQQNDELGHLLANQLQQGQLMSNELLLELVDNYLQNNPPSVGILGDGVIRTLQQYHDLQNLWTTHHLDAPLLIHLDLSEEVALSRIAKRREETIHAHKPLRSDDTPEAINQRFTLFRQLTEPVIGEFKRIDRCITINADTAIEEIHQLICTTLESYYPSLSHGVD